MRSYWKALVFRSLLLAGPALTPLSLHAQTPAQASDRAGLVTPYPAAFFADYSPRTALDMVGRLPAFSINNGDGGRGLGQGGNVLIDGERPTSKSDSLGDILGRMQASSIERIDLIQGSASGVDMQGYSVIANVIRRKNVGLKGSIAGHLFSTGGNGGYQIEGQAQREFGAHKFSGSFEIRPAADPFDHSTRVRRAANGDLIEQSVRGELERGKDYEATVAYEGPAGPGRLRATLVGGFGEDAEGGYELVLAPVASAPDYDAEGGRYESAEINLSYTWPLTGAGEAELAVIGRKDSNESDSYAGPSTFSQIRDSSEVVALAALRFQPIGRWTLNGGVEVALNALDTVSVLTGPQTIVNPAIVVEELRAEASALRASRPRHASISNLACAMRSPGSRPTASPARASKPCLSPSRVSPRPMP